MFARTLGDLEVGIALLLLALFSRQLTDAFGQNLQNFDKLADMVTKTALKLAWVAIGAASAAYLVKLGLQLENMKTVALVRESGSGKRQSSLFFSVFTTQKVQKGCLTVLI